jgi:ABC-type lipoprotein export system ATPase subunit
MVMIASLMANPVVKIMLPENDISSVSPELQIIRENQVVVVVGETGSGKTTQMTQVYCLT